MAVGNSWESVGLDTNILCYAMDPAFPEHPRAASILKQISRNFRVAVNPTVLHETYHTLVYKQRWERDETGKRLLSLLRQKNVSFLNQTKSITTNAIYLANKYELGGRDSLILSNYMISEVDGVYTHDAELLQLGSVAIAAHELQLADPLI